MATKLNGAPGAESTRFEVNTDGGLASVKCVLTGSSPLLMNAMPRDVLLGLAGIGEKRAKTAEKPAPKDVAETHVYRGADGEPVVPSRMLYAALMSAGVFIRLDGKRQVSTKSETNLPGLMRLGWEPLQVFLPGTDEPAPFEVDIQQGRNPNGGEAVCIIRPCFYRWEIRPVFEVDRKVFSLKSARELVELAGRRMGVGDFRPQRRGMYGMFAITRWDES